jgi:hypothetical protein
MTNYIICAHKTSLTPPLFIEVPVPSQEIEWSCICMLWLSTISFYDFSVGVWICSDRVIFFVYFVLLIVCIAYTFVSLCYS